LFESTERSTEKTVVRGDGADPVDLVRGDRNPEPGSTDEQCPVRFAGGDHLRGLDGDQRVGGVPVGVDTDIDHRPRRERSPPGLP